MGTRTELEDLRARIGEAPRNKQGHRQYSADLRDAVREYANRRLRGGTRSSYAVAGELGISSDTLWGWTHRGGSSGSRRRETSGLPERAKEFRAALAALGPRGRTTPYPPELRVLGLAHLKDREAGGASARVVASELGIGADTLRKWSRPRDRRAAVRRVSIVPRAATPTSGTKISAAVVVHGPGGLRIEGLDVAMVVALLRGLS